MNFATATKVLETIRAGDDVAWYQAENRQRINDAANGSPPLDKATADKMNLRINVNFGDLTVPLAHARRNYEEAVLGQERYFKVTIPQAPEEKKVDWGLYITGCLNDQLREDEELSERYAALKEYEIGALVSHGIAPKVWYGKDDILPEFVAPGDIRIPTDTYTSFSNMEWFAVRHRYTPGEMVGKVWGEHTVPGWNKKAVAEILKSLKNVNYGDPSYTWETDPERMAGLVRQNMGYFSADAMPTIALWNFYFKDQDGGDKWYCSVVPDRDQSSGNIDKQEFLFESDTPVASKLSHLLQCQYGDLNTETPFMFHNVRSLGFILMDPTWWSNLTRCRILQHAHESMNIWLKVTDPAGRARAQMVELFEKCIVPEGVQVVPQSERHQIDSNLIVAVQSQLKQLTNEASASYTHELDAGTQKEQTATETMANLQRVNAMMSALLSRYFRKEKWFHREVCRRYTMRNTTNEHAKKFQEKCRRYKIPDQFVDVEMWIVEPVRPMGSGNPTMALLQADKMMELRPMLEPQSQQEVLHDAISVYTNDPRRAARLVPITGKRGLPSGVEWAQANFGTLMQGVPIQPRYELPLIDQIETLLGLLAGKCAGIQQRGGTTDADNLSGLMNTSQFIGVLIGQLAQNQAEKPRVKQYSDALNNLNNEIKGFAQRLQEQQQSQSQQNPEAAKNIVQLQGKMMMDRAKAKQAELNQTQKRRHKELAWQSDQKRKNATTLAEEQRKTVQTVAEMEREALKAAAETRQQGETSSEQPEG